jgi:two-component system response regulator FixJ
MQKNANIAPLVAVVDDQRDLRSTLGRGLERHGYRVHPFASGADLLDGLQYLQPDCILLDFRMPDLDGLATMKAMPKECRHIPVIFFTSHGDIPLAVEAMRCGAVDFIEKPGTFAKIVEKIDAALMSRQAVMERSHSASEARKLLAALTKRELEVMRLACQGLQNKEVATRLQLSVRTVESYRHQAMRKLGENKLVNIARILQTAEGM